jgi:hypothetical protein
MGETTSRVLERQAELVDLRAPEQAPWGDIARIIRTDETNFSGTDSSAPAWDDVWDSTPLYAHDDFVGGLFGESVNPAERWMEFTIEDQDLAKWGPVQAWLWQEATRMYASLSPAVSGFYPEATAWFADGGAFGNGFIYQEEAPSMDRIVDQAMPLGQMFIDVDFDGTLNTVGRQFFLTGRQKKARFKDYAGNCDEKRRYKITHLVEPNEDWTPGKLGTKGMRFASTYVSEDDKDFETKGGYYELPYHWLAWTKQAGRVWARGPGHLARADMNMNNEMSRSSLVDAQFAAEPMILTRTDKLSASDIRPRAILSGQMNEQGKPLMQFAQRGDNPLRAEDKLRQVRDQIREAFLFSLWAIVNRPQMTASEFLGWKEEKFRRLGPQLVRVHRGLASFVARRWRILSRAGQTAPPPKELQGRAIAIEFVSPLAKAQKAATGRSVLQWIGSLSEMAAATQRPEVLDIVNFDGSGRVLHDAMVGLPDVIHDQDTVQAMRQARAQAMQQRAQMEQMAQGAGIFADVAHASQAMTKSQERLPGRPPQAALPAPGR